MMWGASMTIGASMRDCALHHYDDRSSYDGLCSTPQWCEEQLWGTVLYTTMMWGAAMRDCTLHHYDVRSSYEGLYSTPQWCEEQLWGTVLYTTMIWGAAMRTAAERRTVVVVKPTRHSLSSTCNIRYTDKNKFSSYTCIRKFRVEQLQSHIWRTASLYMGKYLRISSYIRKPFLIHDFATAPLWISLYMRKIWFNFLLIGVF